MPSTRRKQPLNPRKRPVQERSQRTVDYILEAAAQVFARSGYEATTTNHIAERAGVSIGTLYEYFPSKDALLVALVERHIREGETLLEQVAVESDAQPPEPIDLIRRVVGAMVELHARDRALHQVLFEEAPMPAEVRQFLADVETRAVDRLELLLRGDPYFAAADPRLTASIVVKTIEGLTHDLVARGDPALDLTACADEIIRLVSGYLANADSATPQSK